jgi:D-tyrosyl-tRNA(Tyr) deacylase
MIALLQRVTHASVSVEGKVTGEIGKGLVILLGIKNGDTSEDVKYLAEKCVHLRIFEDDAGKMNRSVREVPGAILVISQFTLYGDTRKGRRPGFIDAAPPEISEPLYEAFVAELRRQGLPVATGIFGAKMQVEIHNDGPVTVFVKSKGEI